MYQETCRNFIRWNRFVSMSAEELLQCSDALELAHSGEVAMFASLADGIEAHTLPAVVIGSGHASLWHKCHALVHGMWLETGTPAQLQRFTEDIFAFVTDQGVECALHKIPPLTLATFLPHLAFNGNEFEHDWAPLAEAQPAAQTQVDFRGSLGIPGLLHILHNSSLDIAKSMRCFDDLITKMGHLSRLLRRRDPRSRLLETCFSDPIGRHFHQEINAFSAKLVPGRWGSIAFCVLELCKLERILRHGWDLAKYRRTVAPAGVYEGGVDVAVVNDAVTDPIFWGQLKMFEHLALCIQAALTWAESCPCHGHLLRKPWAEHIGSRIKAAWEKCPLRSCRGPELATGDFGEVLEELTQISAAALLTSLPGDISGSSRAELLQEFDRGRAHLVFAVSLRLQHWGTAPWVIFGCAHSEADKSKRCLRLCLDTPSDHRLFAQLQSTPIKEEAEQCIAGRPLCELGNLAVFLGKLFFCPISERPVEGEHAQIHKRILLARNHSVQYVSLSRRIKEIQRGISKDPDLLCKLASFAESAHSPGLALKAVGLQHHPATASIQSYKDPLHAKIIYHADPATLYRPEPGWGNLPPPPMPPTAPRPALPDASGQLEALLTDLGHRGPAALALPSTSAGEGPQARRGAREVVAHGLEQEIAVIPGDGLLKRHIIRALPSLLELSACESGNVLAIPMPPSAANALTSLHICAADVQETPDVKQFVHNGQVFLQLIRKGVGDVVRPNKATFARNDWAVMLLRVTSAGPDSAELHVSPVESASSAGFVLSLEALPTQVLKDTKIWALQPDMCSQLCFPDSVPLSHVQYYSQTLTEKLLSSRGFQLSGTDPDFQVLLKSLRLLEKTEMVRKEGDAWTLTEAGRRSVTVGHRLSDCKPLVVVRDPEQPVNEMELFDLLLRLENSGWQAQAVASKKSPAASTCYLHAESPKIWYYVQGREDDVCKEYFQCLLTASEHCKPVPHLKNVAAYMELLGRSRNTTKRKSDICFLQDEELWSVPKIAKPERKQRCVADAPGAEVAEFFEEDTVVQAIEEMLDESVSEGGSDAEQPLQNLQVESHSESESETSSSSTSSDSSGSSASGDSDAAARPAPAALAGTGIRHKRDRGQSQMYGLCRITPTKTGFQMTCAHPDHHTSTASCTKSRSSAIGGADTALRLLKAWAILGRDATSKEQHQQQIWKQVLRSYNDGTLASEEELDLNPVCGYPGS
ncbi:unnamed protein product [Effrenium voratum]|uniref:Uncharacterized protein n=1 Tax=Effrenium voratum TaxID=2562239 RepID=A0AA36N1G6_9DINO|nr:unnamed protein product [Effrenium voratum]